MMFQVSYKRFLEEIRIENITPEGKDKLEVEDLDDMFAYYLVSIDRNKTFVFVASKTELSPTQKMYLDSISRSSKRVIDIALKKSVNEVILKVDERKDFIESLKRKFNP